MIEYGNTDSNIKDIDFIFEDDRESKKIHITVLLR